MTASARPSRVGMGEQGAGMAGGEGAFADLDLHGGGQVEQAEGVGDVAAGFADGLAELLLGHAELLEQAAVAFGFLDGVEVLALQVLDQGGGHGVGVGEVADQGRHFVQSGGLGGAPAAFAGDDLEAVRRRRDAGRARRGWRMPRARMESIEFGERVGVDRAARLEGAGLRGTRSGSARMPAGLGAARRGGGVAEQGGEAAAEAGADFLAAHAARPGRRVAAEQFGGELHVGLRAGRADIVER